MAAKPDAFLSYTRFDDRRGKISEFREWLSDAVEEVSGHPFDIFQDIEGIGLGEKWQDVLDQMLDQARFFMPILTPKFFNSGPCRDELTKFLELERKTGRQDLVLPIYWITCPVLEEGHLNAKDELVQAIDERQRWDWRELRYEAFESREVQRRSFRFGVTDRTCSSQCSSCCRNAEGGCGQRSTEVSKATFSQAEDSRATTQRT